MNRGILLLVALVPLACDTVEPTGPVTPPPTGPPPTEPPPTEPPPDPAGPDNFFSVEWSDARGEAVYSGYTGILTFDPVTGETRVVTTENAGGGSVAVSADGTAFYTVRERPGDDPNRDPDHLWRVDLDTGERTLLVEHVADARFARDADVALLTRKRRGPDPDSLFVLDLASGEMRYLREGYPASLSPDGRRALVRPRFENDLPLIDTETGAEIAVTPSAGAFVEDIQWGPNGPVAFRHTSTPDGNSHLGRVAEVDLLTGAETVLWEGRGFLQFFYGWEADDHLALFTTFVCRPTPFGDCVFGSTTRRVATDGEDRTFRDQIYGPTTLSSDGEWLVATRYSEAQGDVPVAYRVSELD